MDETSQTLEARGAQPDDEAGPNSEQSTPTQIEQIQIPDVLPIIPVRKMVMFPGSAAPLTIGRPATLKLVEEALPQSRVIGIVTQRDGDKEEPEPNDLYSIGSAVTVLKLLRQPNGGVLLLIQGVKRIRVRNFVQTEPFMRAEVEVLETSPEPVGDKFWEATVKNLRDSAARLVELNPEIPEQAKMLLLNIEDAGQLADFLVANVNVEVEQKQAMLEELDVVKRVRNVQQILSAQIEIAELQRKIHQDVQSQFSDVQRRAYLHEQIRAIQRELGETDSGEEQIAQLRQRLDEAGMPQEVKEHADREVKRLEAIPPASPEHGMIVSYLELMAELPWNKLSSDNLDLEEAQRILDRDHYDLEKVKRRIVEYLAVRKLNPQGRGPILCFLGPPGVGKTSLGQSIADALGRKFSRMSFGGIRDEAEIRGHRRTYIGAMPGRIIQEVRRVGTRNPVLMLDEVDKIGADFRGDPASALLEVLDPRQNNSFGDRYLDVPFDLSQVIFIATANYIEGIPAPLRDRMEIIRIPGYTEEQKLHIAQNYLVRRQLEENGLKPEQCTWEEEALRFIISDYTREAGVRELERQIGSVCRGIAAEVARGNTSHVNVTRDTVRNILGPEQYIRETRLQTSAPGVVQGLAYTTVGGEILHIEAAKYAGSGKVTLTGQIGDVMKESAQAAFSLVRTRADKLGIPPETFKENDIHVHVPAGAVPKDGPSAGVAMFTAIASLFTNTPVRSDVAMTGEITLRGLVLPIGGLKEKSLAALRAGISTVIAPKLNEKDLADLPEESREKLRFVLAENVDEVLAAALERAGE